MRVQTAIGHVGLLLAFTLSFLFLSCSWQHKLLKNDSYTEPTLRKKTQVLVLGTAHLGTHDFKKYPRYNASVIRYQIEAARPDIICVEYSTPKAVREFMKEFGFTREILAMVDYEEEEASLKVKEYTNRLRLKPENAELHNQLAIAYCILGEYLDALCEWYRVLQLDPSHMTAMKYFPPPKFQQGTEIQEAVIPSAVALGCKLVPIDILSPEFNRKYFGTRREMEEAFKALPKNQLSWLEFYKLCHKPDNDGRFLLQKLNFPAYDLLQRFALEETARLADIADIAAASEWVGYCEERHAGMLANVIKVIDEYPGQRIVVVVGAAHGWYHRQKLALRDDIILLKLVDPPSE